MATLLQLLNRVRLTQRPAVNNSMAPPADKQNITLGISQLRERCPREDVMQVSVLHGACDAAPLAIKPFLLCHLRTELSPFLPGFLPPIGADRQHRAPGIPPGFPLNLWQPLKFLPARIRAKNEGTPIALHADKWSKAAHTFSAFAAVLLPGPCWGERDATYEADSCWEKRRVKAGQPKTFRPSRSVNLRHEHLDSALIATGLSLVVKADPLFCRIEPCEKIGSAYNALFGDARLLRLAPALNRAKARVVLGLASAGKAFRATWAELSLTAANNIWGIACHAQSGSRVYKISRHEESIA